VLHKG